MKDLRAALVVCRCPVGEIAENLQCTAAWSRRAAERGADLVCFPELNISGYCNQPVMSRLAQPIPGPITRDLSSMADEIGLVIMAGLAERTDDGRIFASHVVARPRRPIEVYRKLHLAPPERKIFTAGERVPTFNFGRLHFGVQLCYDAHFPGLATHMAEKGVEVIFIPHASPRGDARQKYTSWMRHLPARAFDNGLFVLACNQIGENGTGLTFPGNAVALSPGGEIITRRVNGRPGMLMVDLKRADLKRVRGHAMRYFFPHRRTDLYG
jgi:predicted amidohydrolase